MSFIDGLGAFGAIASILALHFTIGARAKAWFAKVDEANRKSQAEMATALSLVAATSSSQPARADLGTYVLLEIEQKSDFIHKCRSEQVRNHILLALSLLAAINISHASQDSVDRAFSWTFSAFAFYSLYSAVRWGVKEFLLEKEREEYRSRVQEVWLQHIRKRLPPPSV